MFWGVGGCWVGVGVKWIGVSDGKSVGDISVFLVGNLYSHLLVFEQMSENSCISKAGYMPN